MARITPSPCAAVGLFFLLLLVLLQQQHTQGAPTEDEIISLPGYSSRLPSKMYSGYLIHDDANLFYWYVEAETNADTAPLTVWYNGGPGCSSLGGFFLENGPFIASSQGNPPTLGLREFRWSRFSNMLWIENPKGVGFSFSSSGNYSTGDSQAAADNFAVLQYFLTHKFPELNKSNRDLYLAGESYAGIYVPMLAKEILEATDAGTWDGPTLKGIAVGNGCTGSSIGSCSDGSCQAVQYSAEFLLGLAFIPPALKTSIVDKCDWSKCNQTRWAKGVFEGDDGRDDEIGKKVWQSYNNTWYLTNDCLDLLEQANKLLDGVNIYGVYLTCPSGSDGCVSDGSSITPSPTPNLTLAPTSDSSSKRKRAWYGSGMLSTAHSEHGLAGPGPAATTSGSRRRTSGKGYVTPHSAVDHINAMLEQRWRDENDRRSQAAAQQVDVYESELEVEPYPSSGALAADGQRELATTATATASASASQDTAFSCYVGASSSLAASSLGLFNITKKYYDYVNAAADDGSSAANLGKWSCTAYCDASSGITYYSMMSVHLVRPLLAYGLKMSVCKTSNCNVPIPCKVTSTKAVHVPTPTTALPTGPVDCLFGLPGSSTGSSKNVSQSLPSAATWASFECALVCTSFVSVHAREIHTHIPVPIAAFWRSKLLPSMLYTCRGKNCNNYSAYVCPAPPSSAPTTAAPTPTELYVNGTFKRMNAGSLKYLDDDAGPSWAATGASGPSSCSGGDAGVTRYLMNPLVQAAIHAKPIEFCWNFCNTAPGWSYDRTMQDETKEVYPYLLGRINVLIYNGDTDNCVPWTDNLAWVTSMKLPVKRNWHPWYYHSYEMDDDTDSTSLDAQLGGYMVEYVIPKGYAKGRSMLPDDTPPTFHFITIRGSGHMAPGDSPEPTYSIISRYEGLMGSVLSPYGDDIVPRNGNAPPAAVEPSSSNGDAVAAADYESPGFIAVSVLLALSVAALVAALHRLSVTHKALLDLQRRLVMSHSGEMEMGSQSSSPNPLQVGRRANNNNNNNSSSSSTDVIPSPELARI